MLGLLATLASQRPPDIEDRRAERGLDGREVFLGTWKGLCKAGRDAVQFQEL